MKKKTTKNSPNPYDLNSVGGMKGKNHGYSKPSHTKSPYDLNKAGFSKR